MEAYLSSLRALAATAEASQCAEVVKDGPRLVADARFDKVNLEGRVWILSSVVLCAVNERNERVAFDGVGMLAPISTEDWPRHLRIVLAVELNETEEAISALRTWSQANPAAVSQMKTRSVWELLRKAGELKGERDRRLEVHDILSQANYRSQEPFGIDAIRIEHARLLLQNGRVSEARRRVEGIVKVVTHVEMAADRTFDPIRSDEKIDFAALAATEIESAVAVAKAHPRLLEARYREVQAYRQAGRFNDAVAAADAALAAVAADASQFDDSQEYVSWLHNDRAYSLYELGRNDEGRAAMRAGIAAGEGGHPNVSQVINLAELLVDEGRLEEALAALKELGHASAYGSMWAEAVRACAAAQNGDAATLEEALAKLRENEKDNVAALQRSLLCGNQIEEAAALYIKRLADPSLRDGALLALQNWQEDPANLPFRKEVYRRLDVLRARPDVEAAIAAVGRVLDLPLIRAYWGSF